jgi:hypothetical protein
MAKKGVAQAWSSGQYQQPLVVWARKSEGLL